MFSIVQSFIPDAVVLDLFSGTGSLGLEALSRGAKYVYLNDFGRESNLIIEDNVKKCNMSTKCKILKLDYKRAIDSVDEKIDIVFLDPPYEKGFIHSSIEKLLLNDIMNVNGLIICEHGKKEEMKDNYNGIKLRKQRRYGIATISIYKKED